ncbi:MAG: PA14 domain-containing protein [Verrucomicrobiota bacterium]|nr:PA14 domain-containing protein [Verrucomicrobiota bacterium]
MDTARDVRLTAQLKDMERRLKNARFARAAGYALLLTLAALGAAAWLDHAIALTFAQRGLLTFCCYATVLSFVWFGWLWPFLRPLRPETVAWMLEKAAPEFNEKLISSVELSGRADARISMEMIRRVLQETETDLLKINPRDVFPLRPRRFILPAVVLALFLVALGLPELRLARSIKRVMLPSLRDATVGRFDLLVLQPLSGPRPEGEPVHFVVRCTDPTVRRVELCMEDQRARYVIMQYDAQAGLFRYSLPEARKSCLFWARCGAVISEKRELTVLARPRIERFTIGYVFPAYMKLPTSTVESTSGDVKTYRGVAVNLTVHSSKSLSELSVEWLGEKKTLPLAADSMTGQGAFVVTGSGVYSARLRDASGLENLQNRSCLITAIEDSGPTVRLDRPKGALYLEPKESLALAWTADDDFGVESQELRYRINKGSENIRALGPKASSHTWVPAEADAQLGSEIEYYVRVHDGGGHSADSKRLGVVVVRGGQLPDSESFLSAVADLRKQFGDVAKRLATVRAVQEEIRQARLIPSGASAENLEHNRYLLAEQKRCLSKEIELAEETAARLKASDFFPASRVYTALEGRFLRQERLFSVPVLSVEAAGERAFASLTNLAGLSTNLADALYGKAQEQLPWLEARQMSQTADRLGAAADPQNASLRERFRERAAAISADSDLLAPRDFPQAAASSANGLRAEFYAITNRYVTGRDRSLGEPRLTRVDRGLNFADVASFGVGDAPFAAFWSGFLQIKTPGKYGFFLVSDAGSRLYVDGRLVVANDGIHEPQERGGAIELGEGPHALHALYFNSAAKGLLTLAWQPPNGLRQPIPESVLFADRPDAFAVRMRALAAELETRAADLSALEAIARIIRACLKDEHELLARLSRELELRDLKEEDEASLSALEGDLRKNAERSADPAEKSDLELAADTLRQALEKKDAARIAAVAEALPDMLRARDLRALEKSIAGLGKDSRANLAAMTRQATNLLAEATIGSRMEKLAEDIQTVRDTPVGDKLMKNDTSLQEASASLAQAANEAHASADALANGKNEMARTDAEGAEQSIEQAERSVARALAEAENRRAFARKRLKRMDNDASEQLADARKKLDRLSERMQGINSVNVKAAAVVARELEGIKLALNKSAEKLIEDAHDEIEAEDGDITLARDKLALASELDGIGRSLLAAEPDALADAARRSHAAANLLEQAEAVARNELSSREATRVREELDGLATRNLAQNVRDWLEKLGRLRQGEQDARRLAGATDRLERNPNSDLARKLGEEAEMVREDVGVTLTDLGREALLEREKNNATFDAVKKDAETPPRAEPGALRAARTRVNDMRKMMAEAQTAAAQAKKTADEIRPHELKVAWFLDKVAPENLAEPERKKLAKLRDDILAEPLNPGVQGLREAGKMIREQNPDIAEKILETADTLHADQLKVASMRDLNWVVADRGKRLTDESARLQRDLARAGMPESADPRKKIEEMNDNLERKDLNAAAKNLAALEQDLADAAAETDQKPPRGRGQNLPQAPPTKARRPAPAEVETDRLAQDNVIDAMENLRMASRNLVSGPALPQAGEKLNRAAEALNRAAQAMIPTAPAAARQPPLDRPGGGRLEKLRRAESVAETQASELQDSWKGVENKIGSDDKARRKIQYDDYYRKATQRYLERLQKEAGEAKNEE